MRAQPDALKWLVAKDGTGGEGREGDALLRKNENE
jgi:hypothetical protein